LLHLLTAAHGPKAAEIWRQSKSTAVWGTAAVALTRSGKAAFDPDPTNCNVAWATFTDAEETADDQRCGWIASNCGIWYRLKKIAQQESFDTGAPGTWSRNWTTLVAFVMLKFSS
jgi:hypothetical protein